MGLFGKLFGGAPPGGDDKRARFSLDGGAGVPLEEAAATSGPFPRSMRVRAVLEAYDLYGSWQTVRLERPEDWPAAREQVLHAYYQQFGLIRLPDGSSTIRWNEVTWRQTRETLQLRYSP